MPTAYKSFRYKAKTTWTSARRGSLSAAEKSNIVIGSPPELLDLSILRTVAAPRMKKAPGGAS
jgi:hypothetical protein